jgi:hypothetical protein
MHPLAGPDAMRLPAKESETGSRNVVGLRNRPEPTAAYHYPYKDFARDFSAILPSLNAVSTEFRQSVGAIDRYVQLQYSNPLDRLERGAALMQVMFYLGRHLEDFENAGLAVCGDTQALVRTRVIHAIYELLVSRAFSEDEAPASPQEVIALVLRICEEDSQRD